MSWTSRLGAETQLLQHLCPSLNQRPKLVLQLFRRRRPMSCKCILDTSLMRKDKGERQIWLYSVGAPVPNNRPRRLGNGLSHGPYELLQSLQEVPHKLHVDCGLLGKVCTL